MPGSWPPSDFPALFDFEWASPPSPATMRYNCIAWSVGRTDRKWWPDPWGVGAWFPGVPRAPTLVGFIAGYRSIGYIECDDGQLVAGLEKIAIYATAGPMGELNPTHAAYQLDNGNWTSKLGDFEDIEHYRVDSLNGARYGRVAQYMSRPRQPRPKTPIFWVKYVIAFKRMDPMSDIPSQVDGNLVINLLLQEHAESESLLKRKILGLQLDLIRANEEIGRLRQRMAAIEENVDANQRDGADRGSQPRPNGGGEPEAGAQHRGVG